LAAEFHGITSCGPRVSRRQRKNRSATLTEPAFSRNGTNGAGESVSATAPWRTAGPARFLVERLQRRRAGFQGTDPVLRIGMGGQPLRRAAAGSGDHVAPQVHGLGRVE